jgi:hypothetical protein
MNRLVRAGLQTITPRCLPAPAISLLAVSGEFDGAQVKSAPWRAK